MIPIALASLAAPLVKDVIGLFRKVDEREIPLKEAEAKLEEVLNKRIEMIVGLLQGQIGINQIEATAGRLGWRNWLGKGLTIAVLYQVLVLPVIHSVLSLLILCGVEPATIAQVQLALPKYDTQSIIPMLTGLLGLYTARGFEKQGYAKTIASVDKEQFYATVRQGSGKLTQEQVDLFEKAFANAS